MESEIRELIRINPAVNIDIDPTLLSLFQNAFVWANEVGLIGN